MYILAIQYRLSQIYLDQMLDLCNQSIMRVCQLITYKIDKLQTQHHEYSMILFSFHSKHLQFTDYRSANKVSCQYACMNIMNTYSDCWRYGQWEPLLTQPYVDL